MHRIVARIPSMLNVRMIGGFVIAIALIVTATWMTLHRIAPTRAVQGVTIDGATTYQTIDDFGFPEAFQRSNHVHGSLDLSPAKQQQPLDLLFNPHTSTGFTILRNIIGSSPNNAATIEPHSPGAPSAPPTYVWDGSDQCQVWLSHQAQRYSVTRIIADTRTAKISTRSSVTFVIQPHCFDLVGKVQPQHGHC
jgi:glucuronoarabinoxylan endo-1,4-beta-xylanase